MPLTVLEAMAAGKPVIGSDLPGIRQLVEPGQSGLIFPLGSVEGLADAVAQLAGSSQDLALLSAGARAVANEYPWPVIANRYLKLFESFVS